MKIAFIGLGTLGSPAMVVDVLMKGSSRSWQFEHCSGPMSAMADQIYAVMEQKGCGALDAASLIEYFAPAGATGKMP